MTEAYSLQLSHLLTKFYNKTDSSDRASLEQVILSGDNIIPFCPFDEFES